MQAKKKVSCQSKIITMVGTAYKESQNTAGMGVIQPRLNARAEVSVVKKNRNANVIHHVLDPLF